MVLFDLQSAQQTVIASSTRTNQRQLKWLNFPFLKCYSGVDKKAICLIEPYQAGIVPG